MMGAHVLELVAAPRASRKLVVAGTVCAYPKFTPVPFREDDLWNGYPEETNAPYGVAKKSVLVGAQAYREQYGLDAIYLLPANLYGPRDNFDLETSHVIPALIRKMLDGARRRSCSGATARRPASSSTSRTASTACVLAAERYDGCGAGQPRHRRRDLDPRARETIAELTGFGGEISWDTSMPNGQPRRQLDTSRARGAVRLRGAHSLARRPRADDRLVSGSAPSDAPE